MSVIAFLVSSYGLSMFMRRLGRGVVLAKSEGGVSAKSLSTSVAFLRKEYSEKGLDEKEVPEDPMELFASWLKDATDAKVLEPNAMCLSTSANDRPSARFVLLKGFDKKGFVWHTNYESRKGEELVVNPNAALTFWWGDLERQIRIEGTVSKTLEHESDEYFKIRPRGSQIGAWSSNQSKIVANREALEKQEEDMITRFNSNDNSSESSNSSNNSDSNNISPVPRPPHWGGFRLVPTKIEFWKGRKSRLHDRILYSRSEDGKEEDNKWRQERLQP